MEHTTGMVVEKNFPIGILLLELEDGSHAILEITGEGEPRFNDRIRWEGEDPDEAVNLDENETYSVILVEPDLPEELSDEKVDELLVRD